MACPLHPMGDREEVLPHEPALRILYLLQILTFNVTGGPHTGAWCPSCAWNTTGTLACRATTCASSTR